MLLLCFPEICLLLTRICFEHHLVRYNVSQIKSFSSNRLTSTVRVTLYQLYRFSPSFSWCDNFNTVLERVKLFRKSPEKHTPSTNTMFYRFIAFYVYESSKILFTASREKIRGASTRFIRPSKTFYTAKRTRS